MLKFFNLFLQQILLFLQIGKVFFLIGQSIELLADIIELPDQQINLSLSLRGRNQQFFLIVMSQFLHCRNFISALQHEKTASYRIIGQEGQALQIFKTYGKNFFIHETVQAMPPQGRKFFLKFYMV